MITEPVPSDEPSGGIGVRVVSSTEGLKIAEAFEKGPAHAGGIRPGDILLSIDGHTAHGMSLEHAAKKLRGKPGSLVVLRVRKQGAKKATKIPLLRSAYPLGGQLSPEASRIRMKEVSLDELKAKVCPAVHAGCNFLYLEEKQCIFTCRKTEEEPPK